MINISWENKICLWAYIGYENKEGRFPEFRKTT